MQEYSNVTRLLCASVILVGKTFRKTLIEHFEQKYAATAPEIGLDTRQLMQVVTYVENWDKKRDNIRRQYGWWFLALAVILALVWIVTRSTALTLIVLFVVGGFIQWRQISEQEAYKTETLLEYFKQRNYNPDKINEVFGNIPIERDVESGLPGPDQNVVVYSGFLPFIGAGINLDRWSFATNITYGKENPLGEALTPTSFEVNELYDAVQERLNQLQFPGVRFQDMLYVNGLDIRENSTILPNKYGRPVQNLSNEVLQSFISNNDSLIRHYKWIHIHYAQDELILSFFLRFSLRGNNLFTEVSRFLLTPPADAYCELDNRRNTDEEEGSWFWRMVGKGIRAGLGAPFSLIGGVFLPLELLSEWSSRRNEKRLKEKREEEMIEEIDDNPRYDWGVATSIRHMVSSERYQHYFQLLDKEMYNRVIERTILDGIVDFLSDHNISTADLKERRTNILNNGVIVQGGNIETQALAVGQGAQATQQTTQTGGD
jgi:hypothetical protein